MPRFHKYDIHTAYFASIDSPNKAYWLGVLAADGCVYHHHNKWVFQFIVSVKDQDWLRAFRDEVKSTHPLRILPGGFGTSCIRFVVTNQVFCSHLLTIGFKSGDILQRVPEPLWPHFIRGIFDGDGSIREDIGKVRSTGYVPHTLEWSLLSQSDELLQSMQVVFAKYCEIAPNKMRFHSNVWIWAVRGNRQVKRIAEYMYPDGEYHFLARKRDKFAV